MKKVLSNCKRVIVFALVLALSVVGLTQGENLNAASKKYVKSMTLSKGSVTLTAGSKIKVKATVKVSGSASKKVTAKSSKASVASVKVGKANKKGVSVLTITGKNRGSATIKVTSSGKNKGKKKITKKIKVRVNEKTSTNTSNPNTNLPNVIVTPTATPIVTPTATPTATPEPTPTQVPNIEVESVEFKDSEVSILVGEKRTITPIVKPENATNKTIFYSTTDLAHDVIQLNQMTGEITAVAPGYVSVIALTANGKSAQYNVRVSEPVIEVESIQINPVETEFYENSTVQLSAVVSPENATNRTISWSSNNFNGATVDENGLVTVLRAGEEVAITATAGGKSDTISFTVKQEPKKEVAVTSVTATIPDLEKNDLGVYTIREGQTAQIQHIIEPADATDQTVTYTVKDNSKCVTVSEAGLITAVLQGNATVVVAAGGKTAEIQLNIITNEYQISLDKIGKQILSTKEGYNKDTLTATVVPQSAIVEWESSNPDVVEFETTKTNQIVLTAKSVGTTTITAKVGDKEASVEYIVTANDYVVMTESNGIDAGSYEFVVKVKYKFSEDSVVKAALDGTTIQLVKSDDPEKVFTAKFKSVNGDAATYTVDPEDFVVTGHYGELNGTYNLKEGQGEYIIESDKGLSIMYTEKAYSNRIAGRVMDEDENTPLEDVLVKTSSGFTTTTDENGYYDVASSNGDLVKVTFTKNGYFEKEEETKVGSQRVSTVNTMMECYDPEKILIQGTLKALDWKDKEVSKDGFTIELQEQNNDQGYDTIATINTKDLAPNQPEKVLTYKFANIAVEEIRDDDGEIKTNCCEIPRELSLKSEKTYQIVVSNGIDKEKVDTVYAQEIKSVKTTNTSKVFKVDLATMKQVKPLSKLKIKEKTFSFDKDADASVIDGNSGSYKVFKSMKLYASNGTKNADILLAEKNDVKIEMESSTNGILTNKNDIDLLEMFGNTVELPKTNLEKDIRYFLVIEQEKNAYSVVEVKVEAAGCEVVIDTMDPFYVGRVAEESAGYAYDVDYVSTTESKYAIYEVEGKKYLYPISKTADNGYQPNVDPQDPKANNLKIEFKVYQKLNGINVYLGNNSKTDLTVDASNAISASNKFEKLASVDEYKYFVVPSNEYVEDTSIPIRAGKSNARGTGDAVANISKVVVELGGQSELPSQGDVFVNSIQLVKAEDRTVVAVQNVNNNVEIVDGKLSYTVKDKFKKIPAGMYKIVYDVSGYEPVISDSFNVYGFEQLDVNVKDDFRALARTGIKGTVICDGKEVNERLYAILLKEGTICAADYVEKGSFSLLDEIGGNDINAGQYTLVIRGPGYTTYNYKKTLEVGKTFDLQEIELTKGGQGLIELYATCNNAKIDTYDGIPIIKRDGEHTAQVNVAAYDPYYMSTKKAATAALRNRMQRVPASLLGEYQMIADGNCYKTEKVISSVYTYKVRVEGDYLETTEFEAKLPGNDEGTKATLTGKEIAHKAPENLISLKLEYNIVGGDDKVAFNSDVDYVVLTNKDGTYNGTIELREWGEGSDNRKRTASVNIPKGFSGSITVYSSGFVKGVNNELDNYSSASNISIPLYVLSNNG